MKIHNKAQETTLVGVGNDSQMTVLGMVDKTAINSSKCEWCPNLLQSCYIMVAFIINATEPLDYPCEKTNDRA